MVCVCVCVCVRERERERVSELFAASVTWWWWWWWWWYPQKSIFCMQLKKTLCVCVYIYIYIYILWASSFSFQEDTKPLLFGVWRLVFARFFSTTKRIGKRMRYFFMPFSSTRNRVTLIRQTFFCKKKILLRLVIIHLLFVSHIEGVNIKITLQVYKKLVPCRINQGSLTPVE